MRTEETQLVLRKKRELWKKKSGNGLGGKTPVNGGHEFSSPDPDKIKPGLILVFAMGSLWLEENKNPGGRGMI
jgi:hypothetical protein